MTTENTNDLKPGPKPKDTTKPSARATPIPQGYDRILSGALKLTLQDRVNLVKAVRESVTAEVAKTDEAAKAAKEMVNGL